MKTASEKQILFARKISAKTEKPLPDETTALAYYVYIRDNVEEYNRTMMRLAYERSCERYQKRHVYNTYMDDEQDADWAASMDFSWM